MLKDKKSVVISRIWINFAYVKPNGSLFKVFPSAKSCRNGGMVDTKDLKSFGLYRLCGFESHFLYRKRLISQ